MLRRGSLATPWGRLARARGARRRACRRDAAARAASGATSMRPSTRSNCICRCWPASQPGVAVVPILVGEHVARRRRRARRCARRARRPAAGSCSAASSDLSHYHPRADGAAARRRWCSRSFEPCDAEGLMNALERDPGHACGGVPAVAVMRASRALGATAGGVRQYGDSGDASGDLSSRRRLCQRGLDRGGMRRAGRTMSDARCWRWRGGRWWPPCGGRRCRRPSGPASSTSVAGAFVTLECAGELRGCIGQVEPATAGRRRRALRAAPRRWRIRASRR